MEVFIPFPLQNSQQETNSLACVPLLKASQGPSTAPLSLGELLDQNCDGHHQLELPL